MADKPKGSGKEGEAPKVYEIVEEDDEFEEFEEVCAFSLLCPFFWRHSMLDTCLHEHLLKP
jgi:hypothetical protein